ncbi:MAG: hypothetical protein AAGF24_00875 [Cyanobacteria bacterium P01_H01_bin.121]
MPFIQPPTETLLIRLPTPLDAALATAAAQIGKSKTDVIITALQQHLQGVQPGTHVQTAQAPLVEQLRKLEQRLIRLEQQTEAASRLEAMPSSPSAAAEAEFDDEYDEPDEILESFLPNDSEH